MGQSPYPDKSVADVITFVTSGNVMSRTDDVPKEIYDVMTACWRQTADERPAFVELATALAVTIKQGDDGVSEEPNIFILTVYRKS